MGTPPIAVPALEYIHNIYGVKLVVTVPDMQKGRGLKLHSSAVKEKAIELDIPVLQPSSLSEESFIEHLRSIAPDIIVVFAFRILPKEVYSIARIGAFNIHTSLLPAYRGAAPINWAIVNGEVRTGMTTFLLNDVVDTGNIILQKYLYIHRDTTAGDLENEMSNEAGELAVSTIQLLESGDYTPIAQSGDSSSAPRIFKKDTRINWNSLATEIKCFINGFSPLPTAWTMYGGQKLNIYKASIPDAMEMNIENIGQMQMLGQFCVSHRRIFVQCNNGVVELLELQLEGKKRVNAMDFANGLHLDGGVGKLY
ncbi:MAG: methionyl-tRNA formyltransferase [Ignavibacteria bacterium]|jgi:methionyl-tRNA formyltransferase|nr:methionyl-tRNA formyltransferase [Ignavibacteria bacterium]